MRLRGLNPYFAVRQGVAVKRQTVRLMAISGGIIGFGGAITTVAIFGRFIDGALDGPGYGWIGLGAAIMGQSTAFGTLAAGLVLSAIQAGVTAVGVFNNLPLQISNIVLGSILILVSASLRVPGMRGITRMLDSCRSLVNRGSRSPAAGALPPMCVGLGPSALTDVSVQEELGEADPSFLHAMLPNVTPEKEE